MINLHTVKWKNNVLPLSIGSKLRLKCGVYQMSIYFFLGNTSDSRETKQFFVTVNDKDLLGTKLQNKYYNNTT